MKIAYFDACSGASGNMILGALIDAGLEPARLEAGLAKLPVAGYQLEVRKVSRAGISATHVEVRLTNDVENRESRGLTAISGLIARSSLSAPVRARAEAVFRRLAEAEGRVHGTAPEKVHFHEVGAVDALVDIVGAAVAVEAMNIERVYCSPVAVGHGLVKCQSGPLPVPAPATLELLKGFPVFRVEVEGELVTPTGAAILTTFASGFGTMPQMTLGAVGYGAGTREIQTVPNLLRVMIGDAAGDFATDDVWLVETNLDDMQPQLVAHVKDELMAAGALDVFATNIQMKKGRPGVMLSVIAAPENLGKLEELIFRETTTFGLRRSRLERLKLERESVAVETAYGPISVKVGRAGSRILTFAPEYEDCRRVAEENDVPLKEVYEIAKLEFWRSRLP